MAPLPHLLLFFGLVLGVVLLPGLDMAFVLASALSNGRRAGLSAVAGMVTGAVGHVTMGALGVAVLLRTLPAAFNAMLILGACYVGWLGIALARRGAMIEAKASAARPHAATFRQAALTNLLNPKAYVFMLAVFPQFVRPAWGPMWTQAAVLWTIIAVTQTGVYGTVALAAVRVRTWLAARPDRQRLLSRAVGAFLVAAALVTLAESWQLH